MHAELLSSASRYVGARGTPRRFSNIYSGSPATHIDLTTTMAEVLGNAFENKVRPLRRLVARTTGSRPGREALGFSLPHVFAAGGGAGVNSLRPDQGFLTNCLGPPKPGVMLLHCG